MSNTIDKIQIQKFCSGISKEFGPPGCRSGIDKERSTRKLLLGRFGFAGDQQEDERFHGGLDKALLHYCASHYEYWKRELQQSSILFDRDAPFGENISGEGATEVDVSIGDIFKLGSALVQVSQARQPCWKLNFRFKLHDMSKRVQNTGRTGWYYRVLEEGDIATDDCLILIDRPRPQWTIKRVTNLLYHNPLDIDELTELSSIPELSTSWHRLLQKRIETQQVENWESRLTGFGSQIFSP